MYPGKKTAFLEFRKLLGKDQKPFFRFFENILVFASHPRQQVWDHLKTGKA
jgi:hypothetical protein